MSSIYDIGHYTQVLWTFVEHGKPLSTLSPPFDLHNRLGYHFSMVIFWLVPIYKLLGQEGLILSHVFFITATAGIIFAIARQMKMSERDSMLISIAFLVNPFVTNAMMWDFMSVSIGVFLTAITFLKLLEGNRKYFIISCLILLVVKEQFGLVVAGMGLAWAFYHKEYKFGFGICALGFLYFYILIIYLMPYLRGTGSHIMLQEGSFVGRYSWIHLPFDEMLVELKAMLFAPDTLLYYVVIFSAFLFLPIISLIFIFPAAIDFFLNSFSLAPIMRSVYSYHSLIIVLCMTVAAIVTMQNSLLFKKYIKSPNVIFIILGVNLFYGYAFAPLPIPGSANVWQMKKIVNYYDPHIDEIKAIIPPQAAIAAQVNIGGNFTERLYAYPYPEQNINPEYIILQDNIPTDMKDYEELALRSTPKMEITKLQADKRFELIYQKEDWYVFRRKDN